MNLELEGITEFIYWDLRFHRILRLRNSLIFPSLHSRTQTLLSILCL